MDEITIIIQDEMENWWKVTVVVKVKKMSEVYKISS